MLQECIICTNNEKEELFVIVMKCLNHATCPITIVCDMSLKKEKKKKGSFDSSPKGVGTKPDLTGGVLAG